MHVSRWILAVSMMAALCGCGGGTPSDVRSATTTQTADATPAVVPSPSPLPSPQTPAFAGKSYRIGAVDGPLAAGLSRLNVGTTEYDGHSTDGVVVVNNTQVEHLDSTQAVALRATFENHQPIILLHASSADLNLLMSTVGEPFSFSEDSTAATPYAEAFAIQTDAGNNLYIWQCDTPSTYVDADPNLNWSDSAACQQARAERLVGWLEADGQRLPAAGALSDADLQKVSAAQLVERVQVDRGVIYQLSYLIHSCHVFNQSDKLDSDWFFVQQNANVNYSGAYAKYTHYEGYPRDALFWYGGSLTFDSAIPGTQTHTGLLSLLKSSPDTVNNVTTLTSGLSYSFVGRVGFNSGKLIGSLLPSVSYSSSKSFSIRDATAVNLSGAVTNAAWRYEMARARGIRYIFYAGLDDAPALARSNFQPSNQWIWRATPELRNDPAGQEIVTRILSGLVQSEGGGITSIPFVGPDPRHREVGTELPRVHIPLRYPPLIVPPATLTFPAAPGFKPAELGVARPWKMSSDQPWCTISPSSGDGTNTQVYVTVESNGSGADRTATLTLETVDGKASAKSQVIQSRL